MLLRLVAMIQRMSQPAEPDADVRLDAGEVVITVDPIHELKPVGMMQALQC